MMDYMFNERDRYEKSISKLMRGAQSGYDRDVVNATLDDLNSIDYSNARFIKTESLNPVFCKTAHLIPQEDELLVTKFSQWLTTAANNKDVRFNQITIDTLCRFLLETFHQSPEWTQPEILRALGAVLYENGPSCPQFLDELLSGQVEDDGLLLKLLWSGNSEVKRTAVQCIGNICMKSESGKVVDEVYLQKCYIHVLNVLHEGHKPTDDDVTYLRLLLASLKCLQNLLAASKTVHTSELGRVLAALKLYDRFDHRISSDAQPEIQLQAIALHTKNTFQLLRQYGFPDRYALIVELHSAVDPGLANPWLFQVFMLIGLPGFGVSPVIQPSLLPSSSFLQERSPSAGATLRDVKDGPDTPSTGKKAKRKPKRGKQPRDGEPPLGPGDSPSGPTAEGPFSEDWFGQSWPLPGKVSSSESEYSDTEGGQASKLRSLTGKVRHAALGCLHAVFKNTEKRSLFGYWSFFVPDAPLATAGPPPQTLFTSIIKENNAKCRAGSVMVLSTLLEGSKQFLVAAEDREHNRAAFTAFSQTLASMIKEIHRCLHLSLTAETYGSNITQIIKCMSILVSQVPYHKLDGGLLIRIVKSMQPFYQHKDNRVRTACLTCLGAVVSASAPLAEVHGILSDQSFSKPDGARALYTRRDKEEEPLSWRTRPTEPPESTSTRGSQPEGGGMSWLLRWCCEIITGGEEQETDPQSVSEVLPVRLEALQVLTQFIKNYFDLIQPFLPSLTQICKVCLKVGGDDQVKLHGLKVLEELGKSMLLKLEKDTESKLSVDQVVGVWEGVLSGPLPSVLQDSTHLVLQASACDCLGTIGPGTIERLPMHHRILIMTVLLGLVNEDDYRLKMASIRALGVIVQYPALRQDVTFVADTANAVLSCMLHSSVNVRMRAAWSLGNLCDALHCNIESGDKGFLQAFSELLLQRLLEAAIAGAGDHDKVKSNSVRALGLLGRILEAQTLKKQVFQSLIDKAVQVLLKNINTGAMKVRWNSCYALGNFFRNPHLPAEGGPWPEEIFTAFTKLLVGCKNFKVRINAALSLSLIEQRESYGDQIPHIWSSLLQALELIDDVAEVSELKYRNTLRQQLCQTIVHLSSILTQEDMSAVLAYTLQTGEADLLVTNISSYVSSLRDRKMDTGAVEEDRLLDIPHAISRVQKAKENIAVLIQECSGAEQGDVITQLQNAMGDLSLNQLECEPVK